MTSFSQFESHLYIFCSDGARNGKTLLSRIFCSYLPPSGSDAFQIFDTDFPEGNLALHFPENAQVADFSKTTGRMQILDGVINQPERNHIVDLQSSILDAFFETFRNLDFDRVLNSQKLGVVVFYMLDKTTKSVNGLRSVANNLQTSELVIVENEAVGRSSAAGFYHEAEDVFSQYRRIIFPRLSDDLLALLETPGAFDLFDFMAGNDHGLGRDTAQELWDLMDFFYRQRQADRYGVTHFL